MSLLLTEHETIASLFTQAGFDVIIDPRTKVVDAYMNSEFIYRVSADEAVFYLESMSNNMHYWISYTPTLASAYDLTYWLVDLHAVEIDVCTC